MSSPATIPGQHAPPLCDEQGPIPTFPPVALDPETGRIIWPSEEELAARRDAVLRTLKAIIQLPDDGDPPDVFEEGMRDIDAYRPAGQKLFEGMY